MEEPVKMLAEPLQQIDRTCVLWRGRSLVYFGGCDYFRLSSHPTVMAAMQTGLKRFGLNAAASRKTTGNHVIYGQLEKALARFFRVEQAVLFSAGYFTNMAVAQAFAGQWTHFIADQRAHLSLLDAARMGHGRVQFYPHRDARRAVRLARRLGPRARVGLLTDGLFSHSGQVAPLDQLLTLLPRNVTLLVDDAHGAGTIGRRGGGTLEYLDIQSPRIIRTVTLSKAFGVYGGAVLGTREVCRQVIAASRVFTGNTPLPLPLAHAAMKSLQVLREDAGLRRRLAINTGYVKAALNQAGHALDGPGPVVPILPRDALHTAALRRRLLAAGIHPPFIHYPGNESGYFRFAISSEHTPAQLDSLIAALI